MNKGPRVQQPYGSVQSVRTSPAWKTTARLFVSARQQRDEFRRKNIRLPFRLL